MENPGILSMINMEEDEEDLFLDYLHCLKETTDFDVLASFFGMDNLLEFFDVFSGETIKVPRRSYLMKVIKYVKIYKYCEARSPDDLTREDVVAKAAKVFDRRKGGIVRAVNKVDRVLNKGRVDEIDLD